MDIACVDSRAAYEQAKAGRFSPAITDVAGNSVRFSDAAFSFCFPENFLSLTLRLLETIQFRPCAIDTYTSITSGECANLFAGVMKCNAKNEYSYGRMCKDARRALESCAAKNKYGEFGKKY